MVREPARGTGVFSMTGPPATGNRQLQETSLWKKPTRKLLETVAKPDKSQTISRIRQLPRCFDTSSTQYYPQTSGWRSGGILQIEAIRPFQCQEFSLS